MNMLFLLALVAGALAVIYLGVKYIGGDITVIDDWKRAYRFYSTWAFALIAALPDMYNAVIASGFLEASVVDGEFSMMIKFAAVAGLVLRLVQQRKPEVPEVKAGGTD